MQRWKPLSLQGVRSVPNRRLYRNSQALRQLIQARMDELNLHDTRSVETHSRGLVSYSVVYAILMGTTKQVRYDTLTRLAKALSVDLKAVVEAADDRADERAEPWIMPDRFFALPLSFRVRLEYIIDEHLDLYMLQIRPVADSDRTHGKPPDSDGRASRPGKTG